MIFFHNSNYSLTVMQDLIFGNVGFRVVAQPVCVFSVWKSNKLPLRLCGEDEMQTEFNPIDTDPPHNLWRFQQNWRHIQTSCKGRRSYTVLEIMAKLTINHGER
jgi:hypothetical protein